VHHVFRSFRLTDQRTCPILPARGPIDEAREEDAMNRMQARAADLPATIPWWTDLEAAQAHAREAQRPLYVDIWAPG
jgi:hypothetical protein